MRVVIMSKISYDIFKKLINEMNGKILPTTPTPRYFTNLIFVHNAMNQIENYISICRIIIK